MVVAPADARTTIAPSDRYEIGGVLGAGGMGEVRVCADRRIGRRVAMKTMHPGAPAEVATRARFLREARVQGQTEHPSIVPVYDIGADDAGVPYFTMRCVEGRTLAEIFRLLQKRGTHERDYSLRKLLVAFGSVCLAVEFAHSRGIVHCDLKPANVMLGSFGEVYVLDWGLASRAGANDSCESEGGDTQLVFGTPGYAAPEQIRGEPADPRWDVYALGALLYEILTLEPMIEGASPDQLFGATLRGNVERPSRRTPGRDVPPELEAVWAKATILDPRRRYARARDLYDDLERYLEGDRDLVLRRELSREHAARAASLAERALAGPTGEPSARSEALGAVGRALALDPDNADALRTLVGLLTEPPADLPPEAREDLHATERGLDRIRGRSGFLMLVLWATLAPLAFLHNGVRDVRAFVVITIAGFAAAGLGLLRMRRPRRDGWAPTYLPLAVAVLVAIIGTVFHPLVIAPTIAMAFAVGYTLSMDGPRRFLPMIAIAVALAIPVVLESLGVVPQNAVMHDGMWCMAPRMIALSGPTSPLPALFGIVCLVAASSHAASLRAVLTDAQRRAAVRAWQLRQLVPRVARSVTRPTE